MVSMLCVSAIFKQRLISDRLIPIIISDHLMELGQAMGSFLYQPANSVHYLKGFAFMG